MRYAGISSLEAGLQNSIKQSLKMEREQSASGWKFLVLNTGKSRVRIF